MSVDDPGAGLPASVLILGAGLMGTQIGLEYAAAGVRTTLCARDEAGLRSRVSTGLETARQAGHGNPAELARLVSVVADPILAERADVVVESLPEDLDTKVAALARAAAHHSPTLVLTNTSSLRVGEIARRAGLAGRLVGAHYWNPPLLMPLVELVVPTGVDSLLADRAERLLRALGKRPVRVTDTPGFAWNRLQFSLLREAAALTREGVISARDLDVVVREGLALRWSAVGPFETMSLGGADTFAQIADNLYPVLSTDQTASDLADNNYLDEAEGRDRVARRDAVLTERLRFPRER
jgi:3-hydroxybutyryl-CoA dehydrogenase